MTQDYGNAPTSFISEIDAMEDEMTVGMTEANNESQHLPTSATFSASSVKESTADFHKYIPNADRQDFLQAEADRFRFEQRVQKLFIDLEDEIGVDILLMSGSHDDPECLAVKAIWVERRRMEELMVKTQELQLRK